MSVVCIQMRETVAVQPAHQCVVTSERVTSPALRPISDAKTKGENSKRKNPKNHIKIPRFLGRASRANRRGAG